MNINVVFFIEFRLSSAVSEIIYMSHNLYIFVLYRAGLKWHTFVFYLSSVMFFLH